MNFFNFLIYYYLFYLKKIVNYSILEFILKLKQSFDILLPVDFIVYIYKIYFLVLNEYYTNFFSKKK